MKRLFLIWLSALSAILFLLNCGSSSPTSPDNGTTTGTVTATAEYTDTLPSALLKTFETLSHSGPVSIHVKNATKISATVSVSVSIQDYTSAVGTATKTIAAGDTGSLSPTIFIDPTKMATLSTLTPSNYQVTVTNSGATQPILQESHLVLLMARDAIPWVYENTDMSMFAALWVTPTAPAVQTFLASAKSYWAQNSWYGYQGAQLQTDSTYGTASVPAITNFTIWQFPLGHGFVSGSIASTDNVQLRFEDTAYIYPFCDKGTSATFSNVSFTGPGDLVLASGNLLLSASVNVSLKYMYYTGAVRQQVRAIFNALKAKGITYSSTAVSFPSGSQKIRFPSDALNESAANCIDGSALMASALEAIGIEPLLVLVPGHCFLAWRELSGSTQCEFLETTMIGSATFEDALNEGYNKYSQHLQAGDLKFVDIALARTRGLLPLYKKAL